LGTMHVGTRCSFGQVNAGVRSHWPHGVASENRRV
jgi:hypothetical protein